MALALILLVLRIHSVSTYYHLWLYYNHFLHGFGHLCLMFLCSGGWVSYQSSDARYSRMRYLLDGTNYHASSCVAMGSTPIITGVVTFIPYILLFASEDPKCQCPMIGWERWDIGQFLPKCDACVAIIPHCIPVIWKLKHEPQMKDSYRNRVIHCSKNLLAKLVKSSQQLSCGDCNECRSTFSADDHKCNDYLHSESDQNAP